MESDWLYAKEAAPFMERNDDLMTHEEFETIIDLILKVIYLSKDKEEIIRQLEDLPIVRKRKKKIDHD